MAELKLVFACVLLALFLFQRIQSSEGRNLGRTDSPKLSTFSSAIVKRGMQKIADQKSNLHGESTKELAYMKESVPAAPMSAVAPSQVSEESRPPPPAHVDNFRPTNPGHSPGIGHSVKN
ncbi:precursor of CEP6-like [Diospyros lotus]|uniref:precursor of CEP6-like n=1 Tax=Diospyros lotus TaxID=55363 RepID=UPI002252D4D2|nr:precursor of CEP6-like [Diospyros lotus]